MFIAHTGTAFWHHLHAWITKNTNLENVSHLGTENHGKVTKRCPKVCPKVSLKSIKRLDLQLPVQHPRLGDLRCRPSLPSTGLVSHREPSRCVLPSCNPKESNGGGSPGRPEAAHWTPTWRSVSISLFAGEPPWVSNGAFVHGSPCGQPVAGPGFHVWPELAAQWISASTITPHHPLLTRTWRSLRRRSCCRPSGWCRTLLEQPQSNTRRQRQASGLAP